MKRTLIVSALASVALLVVVPGIVLGQQQNPLFATKEFVENAIQQFNQQVVDPLADAVAALQGEVDELEQRVETLDPPIGPTITTDRAFMSPLSSPNTLQLIDTDDGTVIETYPGTSGSFGPQLSVNCDGTRALLPVDQFSPITDTLLVDTNTGQVIQAYSAPVEGPFSVFAGFACNRLDLLEADIPLIRNRAAISYQFGDSRCPDGCLTLLIDTDTGAVIESYSGFALPRQFFSCAGDKLVIFSDFGRGLGTMVDTVTGAEIMSVENSLRLTFVCPPPQAE